MLPVYT
jgi:hypothetical protein